MALLAVFKFRDFQQQAGRTSAWVATAAAGDLLGSQIAAVTNAGRQNTDVIQVFLHNNPGVAANYQNIEDKCELVFIDAVGSVHKYLIPAPVTGLFLPDQETVNTADPTGIIADYIVSAQSSAGSALTHFLGGRRLRHVGRNT